MPYNTSSEVPDIIRENFPEPARDIYRRAFDGAWQEYTEFGDRRGSASRDEKAHRVAWSAILDRYRKKDETHWVEKPRRYM